MARVYTYPLATMNRARELASGGWGPRRIAELLDAEGLGRPARLTIQRWIRPEKAQRHIQSNRVHAARLAAERATFRLPGRSPEYRRAFMYELRKGGLSCQAIAVVHGIVFDVPITEAQVVYIFRDDDPKPLHTGARAASAARRRAAARAQEAA